MTEFVHLVDIINQTDWVEGIDGEEKLGQPMIGLSFPRQWGTIDLFVLPYFRERIFPDRHGRLRLPLVVDAVDPGYESADRERHIDVAFRYSHSIGDWDIGLSHFSGTGREPTLLLNLDQAGQMALTPFYHQIHQTSIDLQKIMGDWLLKLEALHRTGQGDDYFASIAAMEHAFVNIAQTGMDLDLFVEWAYDDRGDNARTAFENDGMFGLRLAVNDAASSALLAGFFQDLDGPSRALGIEGSRRFGDNWLLSLELRVFLDQPENDPLYSFREDDYLQLELTYYF